MLIIITGTISPDTNVGQLTIRDSSERLRQYVDALKTLIEQKPDATIIFCDNSGYDMQKLNELKKIASSNDICLELLSFIADSQNVVKYGKGYGEGEIIKYVISNSRYVTDDEYIVKITGRLVVDNISDILRKIKRDRIYFNVPNIHRRDIFDTRLYAMPLRTYKKFFLDEYKKVDDNGGYYLEHVFRDVVLSNKLKSINFPCYPRIVGKSGTGGISYEYTEWKCKIRDILSVFNFYGKTK